MLEIYIKHTGILGEILTADIHTHVHVHVCLLIVLISSTYLASLYIRRNFSEEIEKKNQEKESVLWKIIMYIYKDLQ